MCGDEARVTNLRRVTSVGIYFTCVAALVYALAHVEVSAVD